MTRRALLPVSVACLCIASLAITSPGRELTFQQRVEAQWAIDRVYYRHQDGSAEPFEKAVPVSTSERKVRTYLKESAALDAYWHTPITSQALQAEWKRIARASRLPDRLMEIYAALHHDPVLIQECFVRPILVERLTHRFLDSDPHIQGQAREKAERIRALLEKGRLDFRQQHPNRHVRELLLVEAANAEALPSAGIGGAIRVRLSAEEFERESAALPGRLGDVGAILEAPESYTVSVPLERSPKRLLVATYVVEKVAWETWWHEAEPQLREADVKSAADGSESIWPELSPASPNQGCIPADSWTRGLEEDFPAARNGNTAIWTGTEMIIWGGNDTALSTTRYLRGHRYDPLTDTWRMISLVNAPEPRKDHTAVWTGSRMVVWGGINDMHEIASGGRYDPISDSWSPMATASAPSPRSRHTAVWTGDRMIVWGGKNDSFDLGDGGRYDPATDTWFPVASSNLTPRVDHTAVWTGNRMIVWGGGSAFTNNVTATGAAYDPISDGWTDLSFVNQPSARRRHSAVWTGSKMIVWGGDGGTQFPALDTGKMYEPVAGIWTSMASFSKRNNHRAVWIGSKMMVWGGVDPSGAALNTGGLFDPVTGFWQATTLAGAPAARGLHSMIWTGSRVLVWGGNIREGARYDPQANSWTPMAAGPEGPTSRRDNATIWTGSHLIVWGGVEPFPTYAVLNSGSRYDPITDSWNRTSRESNVPEPRYTFTMVWAGNRMVVWGGYKDTGETFNSGGRYDPIADTWLPTSTVFSPPPYAGAKAVWAGSKVFLVEWVWGASYTYNAFLYDPAADTWAAASTFHQIIPRDECPMIWTGSEVILWGGLALNNAATLDNGGAYDPATDSWRTISQSQNPSPRRYHSAVWTGSEMLFWGGLGVSGYTFNDGGRYNPATDEWSALAGANPPSPRAGHVAIWTGTEMIIWGGTTDTNERLNTGAHYDPVAQQWTPTTLVGAPPALPVSAFWSGQFMLLYEGHQIGGVYAPQQVDGDSDADGYPACSGDCDDGDPAVHPGAFEICNGRDDDCDGTLDNGFPDADEDGVAACGGDCNDVDATIRPGLPEACDDQDNNCNGLVDEGYPDLDNDGYAGCGGDCDDSRAAVHPGMPEICDGLDNDCSGGVDNIDQDGDGYWGCGVDDCDDTNPAVHPGAPEVCNGIDDNCNWYIDEGFDQDADGYTSCGGDCNDANPGIHPGVTEVCNGIDDDCNGAVDLDVDGDGHTACGGGDCDDQDASVWQAGADVTGLTVSASVPTVISWNDQAVVAGPQTVYFLASGAFGPTAGVDFSSTECLSLADPATSVQDPRSNPAPGTGYWFVSAAANNCGWGTYGYSSGGGERAIANCP